MGDFTPLIDDFSRTSEAAQLNGALAGFDTDMKWLEKII